jgi:hypothetical protein
VTLSNSLVPVFTLATTPSASSTVTATLGTATSGYGTDTLKVALTSDQYEGTADFLLTAGRTNP